MNIEEPSATDQFNRTLELGIILARVASAISFALNAWVVRKQVRSRTALRLGAAAVCAHAAYCFRDVSRRGSSLARGRAISDISTTMLAILSEAVAWQRRVTPPDPVLGASYASVANAWMPFQLQERELAVALVAVVASFLASTTSESALNVDVPIPGQRLASVVGMLQGPLTARSFIAVVRQQLQALDGARSRILEETARGQAERERQHQFRILHDSALQLLEAIGGRWDIDPELVERRTDYEIARLRLLVADEEDLAIGSISDGLTSLIAELAISDLVVKVTVEPGLVARPEVVRALTDATREALRNVVKHAYVQTANVHAAWSDGGVQVVVSDGGRGFAVDADTSGFGLEHSVRGRMTDIGGRVTVESRVGVGTRVTLWGPA